MLRTFRRIALLALLVIPALAACSGNGITDESCFTDRDSRQYICLDEQN